MSMIVITFDTDNLQFRNDGDESLNTSAVADILRELANKAGQRTPEIGEIVQYAVHDRNGNRIGYFTIEEDPVGCGDLCCGCDLIETDCCTSPRWQCQTTLTLDPAGIPLVRQCDPGHGCQKGN